VTDITDGDGKTSATITVVERIVGINQVEVQAIDGCVYRGSP